VHFPDWSITVSHHRHFVVGASWPKYFHFFSLRVCHHLSANVCLVCFIEDINSEIHYQVRVVNFFIRCQTKLLDAKRFTSGETWDTSEQLFNVSGLHRVIPWSAHLTVQLLNVFHTPSTVVCWNGSGLTDGMDVPHVVDRRRRV